MIIKSLVSQRILGIKMNSVVVLMKHKLMILNFVHLGILEKRISIKTCFLVKIQLIALWKTQRNTFFSNSSEANCTDLPNLVSQNYLCWSHYKKDWQWKCYDNKNFAELNYTIETTNDVLDGSVVAMDEDSKFELKLRIFEGVPEPIYKLNDIYVEKNDSVDNEIIINYLFWYTDIPTSCGHPYPFELFLKQAGFECQNEDQSEKCRRFRSQSFTSLMADLRQDNIWLTT